ncbi:O-antigen ligase family protein [Aeribacillus pallidus]|uniref:O-antigen ligase-related domain-containing protein n=1 Tax=Aeribacillus pallidus TaxID=33936 RepID=A0A223E2J1_9BACI|nr:O-antigen ligase family protein [Aeribacillus pallidus]ASS89468.1 hypothetical protein AP3564_03685 [Aeribacillus pallidus]
MLKILFSLVLFVSFFLLLILVNNTNKVKIGLALILFSISINVSFQVYQFQNQILYLNLATLVIFIIVISLIFYYILLKNKVNTLKSKKNDQAKNFYILFLSILTIILIICLQFYLRRIYDINLYFHHLTMYITICLLMIWFYLTSKITNYQQNNIIIFRLILLTATINFIISVLQYVFNKSFLPSDPNASINYYEGVEVVKRVWGIVGASNGAGNLGAIFFPILLYYSYKTKSKIALLVFVLNIIFVALTLTRIAYLAIIIELLIFVIYISFKNISYKNLGIRIFVLLFSSFVLSFCIYLYYDDAYKLLFLDRGDTESHRFTQFLMVIDLVKGYPIFGVGAGQYVYFLYSNYRVIDLAVHSQFLNVMVETGTLAFTLYFIIYIYMLIGILKNFPSDPWFPVSLFIGNFIVVNFNPNQYYNVSVYIFIFTSLALLFYKNNYETNDDV